MSKDEDKQAFCYFNERCKKIKYCKKENSSDLLCLHEAINNVIIKDVLLKSLTQNKFILLQMKDGPRLRDIEYDDHLPNDCEVYVIFISLENLQNTVLTEFVPNSELSNIADRVPRITETSNNNNDNQSHKLNIEKTNTDKNIGKTSTEISTEKIGAEKYIEKRPTKRINKSIVPYPAKLPKLTPDLLNYFNKNLVREKESHFISFWASHLMSITDQKPTPTDYTNYALTVVNSYPVFSGGLNQCGVLKQQLSHKIRNERYATKKFEKRREELNSNQNSLLSIPAAIEIDENQPSGSNKDEEKALDALEKCDTDVDSPHIRRLIMETLSVRRKWITSDEVERIQDVINKYPHLKSIPLILYEFQILQDVEMEGIMKRINEILNQLAIYYNIESESEISKTIVLNKFHNEITPKRFKSVNEALFIIKEGGKSTKELITSERASPRAVIYTIDNVIASAYIVADQSVKLKIEEPTTSRVVASLIATYYTWNVNYPSGYKNTLDYLDFKLFKTSISKKMSLEKFDRNLIYKLQSLETANDK